MALIDDPLWAEVAGELSELRSVLTAIASNPLFAGDENVAAVEKAVRQCHTDVRRALGIEPKYPAENFADLVSRTLTVARAQSRSAISAPTIDWQELRSRWTKEAKRLRASIAVDPNSTAADSARLKEQLGELQAHVARLQQDRAGLDLKVVGEAVRRAKDAAEEAHAAADAAKSAAGQAASSNFSGFFASRAEFHEKEAALWRIVTIVLGMLTSIIVVVFAFTPAPGGDWAERTVGMVVRLAAVGTLGAFAFWASAQMRVHQHNAVVNRQKETTVNTFQAFLVSAGDDGATKREVIMEVTRQTYAPVESGWGSDGNGTEYRAPLLQVVTAATDLREVAERLKPR